MEQQIRALETRERVMTQDEQRADGDSFNLMEWRQWNASQVLRWILMMDDRRFMKYGRSFVHRLSTENIQGAELSMITDDDLVYFGVSSKRDRKMLLQEVQFL